MHLLRNKIFKAATLGFRSAYLRSSQKAQKDLYQLLGVSRSADAQEIKKAYYKLAQEYHPDKNPSSDAKEKFTEINNAYQILSDTGKRQMYDQTGQTGEGNAADYNNYHEGGQGFNPEDIFGQFKGFNQGRGNQNTGGFEDILNDLFGGGFNQRQSKNNPFDNSPISMSVTLSFEESVKGVTKIIQFQRKTTCSTCNGKRSRPGTEPQKCRSCQGSGMQSFRQGMFVMKSTCQACGGEGTKIKHLCGTCNGKGFERKKVKEEIEIPRGVGDGMTIKLSNKGNFNGDVFLKMQVKKSPVFQRAGINAMSQLKISVLDAILGAEKEVKTIQGASKKVSIPQGIQSGQTISLKGQGFYMVNSSNKGDHILTVTIEIPKQLTPDERVLYQQIRKLAK